MVFRIVLVFAWLLAAPGFAQFNERIGIGPDCPAGTTICNMQTCCPTGTRCAPDGSCVPLGGVYCGGGLSCPAGTVCANGGLRCVPRGQSDSLPDLGIRENDDRVGCLPGGGCARPGWFLCEETDSQCRPGWKCSAVQGCVPIKAVDCGMGKYCHPGEQCLPEGGCAPE
ncbi:scavenger receptor class F, member 2 [Lutimaribacter marinistellae]|uniref:Scavenger receptor class F, member 2 n=1 Tax=Lutimaribacter marinistellae TaxID=1820329 RepID=A0ABV7TIX9_9RHOB